MSNERDLRRRFRRTPDDDWAPLRWPVALPATIEEHGSCALEVELVDLSSSGCRMWAGFRLTPGRVARLHIAGLATLKGRVVWSENWFAAVCFDTPLYPLVVQHLARSHPPCASARQDTASAA